MTFTPNTIQVPTFVVEAGISNGVRGELLRAFLLLCVEPDLSREGAAFYGCDWEWVERAKTMLDLGRIVNQDTPVTGTQDQDEEQAQDSEAFGIYFQHLIDEGVAKPAPLTEDQVKSFYELCQGRRDVAEGLVNLVQERERYGRVIDRPIGYMFGILRRSKSLDEIVGKSQLNAQVEEPNSIVSQTRARVVKSLEAGH